MTLNSPKDLQRVLKDARVIAVVGHSDKPWRTSYEIGQYLRRAGYKVYAVNPTIQDLDGERVYPNLAEIPEPIDIVNVFRRSEYLADVVDEAIAVKAKGVWGQLGVIDQEAAVKAEAAGLDVVMDRCIKVDHGMLMK